MLVLCAGGDARTRPTPMRCRDPCSLSSTRRTQTPSHMTRVIVFRHEGPIMPCSGAVQQCSRHGRGQSRTSCEERDGGRRPRASHVCCLRRYLPAALSLFSFFSFSVIHVAVCGQVGGGGQRPPPAPVIRSVKTNGKKKEKAERAHQHKKPPRTFQRHKQTSTTSA